MKLQMMYLDISIQYKMWYNCDEIKTQGCVTYQTHVSENMYPSAMLQNCTMK